MLASRPAKACTHHSALVHHGSMCPAWERDPLSVALDPGARRFLARVYAARGGWVQTRLADPDPSVRAWALSRGIDPGGPDNASTISGTHANMRSRWGRAFARSAYYQHRWYGPPRGRGKTGVRASTDRRGVPYGRPLELEVGRHVPARGIIPAGRLVRARLRPGGQAARRAVQRKPLSARVYDDAGERTGGRWSDPARRDWM